MLAGNNGILIKTTEAKFKSKISEYNEELKLYISDKKIEYTSKGENYDENLLEADSTDVKYNGTSTGENINTILTTLNDEYKNKIKISSGKLNYIGNDSREQVWIASAVENKNVELSSVNVENKDSITLENSTDYNVDNLKIYGNSIQNGEPTPDNPVDVESLGENSRNLFDINKAENGTISNVTGKNSNDMNNRCRTGYFYLKAGTYALSTLNGITFGSMCHMYSSADENTWLGATNNTIAVLQNGKLVKTATVTQDSYVRFVLLPNTDSTVTDLSMDTLSNYKPMIEQGTIATEYKPYKYIDLRISNEKSENIETIDLTGHEPLRRVGNVADYIDYKNSQIVRKIAAVDCTTNTYLGKISSSSSVMSLFQGFINAPPTKNWGAYEKTTICSNRGIAGYIGGKPTELYSIKYYISAYAISNHIIFRFAPSSDTTMTEAQFNAHLKQWKTDGQPLMIYYEKRDPTYENITLPQIKAFDVKTNISIDGDIAPSKIECDYYKNVE